MPRQKIDAVQVPFNLPRKDAEALRRLSAETRVSQQQYVREAIADLLTKYRQEART
jgi:hypothetical protein